MSARDEQTEPKLPPASSATSPAYRQARQDRGEATREKLIIAALKVFGRNGFDGATTRQIANEAGVNLAAIVYHFGGKEALYQAVAEHIAAGAQRNLALRLEEIPAATSPAHARKLVAVIISAFVDQFRVEETQLWAPFVMREQVAPTEAFETLFAFMGPVSERLTVLVATALQGRPSDPDIRLKVTHLIGQVLIFRMGEAVVKRHMGWSSIGPEEWEHIRRSAVANAMVMLGGEADEAQA